MQPAAEDLYPFTRLINLANPRLGAQPLSVSDEWFAPCERMLQPQPAVFVDDLYDDNGKWMDGWETRRRRGPGHDFAIIRLGLAGEIHGVDIDTSHFTGNYPPAASLEACYCPGGDPGADTVWRELLPAVSLNGNSHHLHAVRSDGPVSHLRLNIYPDGGIARLRVYGIPVCDWNSMDTTQDLDLFAVANGGRGITCNDEHYGSIANLNMPGRGINMGDGWETRRRREPGNDWAILALGHKGVINAVEIDTAHFKGNYPDRCGLQAACVVGGTDASLVTQSMFWAELLPPQSLGMDAVHRFETELLDIGPVTHVRLNIYPDGGISRVRLFGRINRD